MIALAAMFLHPAFAAHAAVGTPIGDAELARVGAAGKVQVFGEARATVLVFFRPGQARSVEALRELARCQKTLDGRALRWVGLVPDSAPADSVASMVRESGFRAEVLADAGDAIYGSIGIALHPVVVVANSERRLAAFEPFRSVDFCPRVSARVRRALGEIDDGQLREALEPAPAAAPVAVPAGRPHRVLAEALLRSGSLDKAVESARKAVEAEPASAASHVVMGRVLAARGDCGAATTAFARALQLEPANAAARSGTVACRERP